MADFSTTYMGLTLKNPIIIGSSGLSDSEKQFPGIQHSGAGAVVLKSLFEEEILLDMKAKLTQMNTESYLYPETLEFYEHDDTSKEATQKYLELIKAAKSQLDIPVIASINCVTADQWTYFPAEIERAGADALELNVFTLPSNIHRTAAENEQTYFDIIKAVRKVTKIPVSLKLSFYFSDLAGMLKRVDDKGIDGLVLFNRFYNPDFDTDSFEVTSSHVLSTPSDISMPLRWASILSERLKTDISATTGIDTGQDVVKLLLAGAKTVQVASTLYRNGMGRIGELITEMEKWMSAKGYGKVDDFRGKMSQSNTDDPAALERVQFMKYFRGQKAYNT